MKRFSSAILLILVSSSFLLAGGLVTNTNQSAAWARTLTRQATCGIDAVYYNPAGLGLIDNGLHLSLSNQTVFQTRQITNDYPLIIGQPKTYEGTARAPLFPSGYAVFKTGKWAFSAGFNLIGGGGSANFEKGLPSFEMQVASIPAILTAVDQGIEDAIGVNPGFGNIAGYSLDAAFNGRSVYYGIQAGATYAINDMVSVALGGRYVMVNNSYEGSLENIMLQAPDIYGGSQSATAYLTLVGNQVNPVDPQTGGLLLATAAALDNPELEAVQKGSGITPIVGLNVNLFETVNIGLKYEHHTKIELENETTVDDVGMFPDGAKTRADLPGMVTAGVQVSPTNKLTATLGYNTFLDRPAYYGDTDDTGNQINNETTIDKNSYDLALSLEYMLKDNFGLSAGYVLSRNGINETYQSDLKYALQTNSVGGGFYFGIGERIGINAGVVYVIYSDDAVERTYPRTGLAYTESYSKKTMLFAIGLDFHL
ncbi:MAG: hypothetical protein JXR52_10190 [Bacteroidales bacterium]|nr:hypothetical protein [Bacteroidales bacterium]MBN2699182.1 hypothetical protein [Bacteroidales bacterium]